jgi:signal transduction histidine kinase
VAGGAGTLCPVRLRTHLILLTVAAVVPVFLFAIGVTVYYTHLERGARERGMRDTARALALALDRDISDIKTGVQALAASRYLDGRGDLAHFYEEAATVSKSFGGWAVLSDPTGRQILNTSRPLGAELPLPTPASLAMMRSVAAGRKTFVSNVFIGTVSRQPAVIIAVPVVRGGQVRYIIDFPFPPTQFTNLLREAALSRGWIALITDREGGVVARVPDPELYVGGKEAAAWAQQTTGADEGFLKGDVLRAPSVYAAYSRSKETDWVVGVAAPVALVETGLRRTLLVLWGGGLLLLLIACGLAFVIGKRIAAPIVALARSLGRESAPLPEAPLAVAEVQELRRALDEARKAERRAELAQVARREAEAANRAKDEFLAVLSHELRTPLNAIFGWIRMLRSGRLDEPTTARALEVIERNVAQQSRLIGDLLEASRIVVGRLELDMQRVDLSALVAGVVESFRPAADAQQLTLKSALDPEAGPVHGDPDRLRQVVENLLGNAIKFTPAGGTVMVTLARHREAHLVVSDTGSGIEPEFLPHVFERFRQADSTSTRAHAGLGLGLAIVRHIVEMHGGRVRAESPGRDQGATFTVDLPLATGAPAPAGEASPGRGTGPRLDGLRVLVVEDDADTRDLVVTVLTQAGALPTALAAASDAASVARRARPDVLVCDLTLPEHDGVAVMRDIKGWAAETGAPVPAIALTASARAEDRDRALAARFDLYVTKPVDPGELVRAVGRLAGR